MCLGTLLAISFAIASSSTITSQERPAINPGTRVRVTAPSVSNKPLVGTVVAFDADSLVVQRDTAIRRLSTTSITHLDISQSRKSHTLMGAGIGFLVGAGFATALVLTGDRGGDCADAGYCILIGSAVLGGGGAVIGAGIGALVRTDRWAEVPLGQVRVSLTPDSGRALTLRASLSF